ncbi:MAG: SDR family NAD(P)-dependent oxidoreductase [Desulfobacterales bacterium]|jgi:NAD(P)-dependent dehydrogenase (short-subunit alcohol dehydrogenase family)
MKKFKGKIAVVTGAASGIGREIANYCAKEGMKVVLADVEETALAAVEKDMVTAGGGVLVMKVDVSNAEEVEKLATKSYEHFGTTHLLFNNAGVAVGGLIWETTLSDWEWMLGVNLWGVIHGIRSFVPRMIEQDTDGYIVNTASVSGLLTPPLQGGYNVSKHGVVALSETLNHELTMRKTKLKVSVLCPGYVNTRVLDCERNRPVDLQNDPTEMKEHPEYDAYTESVEQQIKSGLDPKRVAELVFGGIREDKFYIHTHNELKKFIRGRMEDILSETRSRPPLRIQ